MALGFGAAADFSSSCVKQGDRMNVGSWVRVVTHSDHSWYNQLGQFMRTVGVHGSWDKRWVIWMPYVGEHAYLREGEFVALSPLELLAEQAE